MKHLEKKGFAQAEGSIIFVFVHDAPCPILSTQLAPVYLCYDQILSEMSGYTENCSDCSVWSLLW